MAIYFLNDVFVRNDEQLTVCGSRAGVARIDAEIKDETFHYFRSDLSVIESGDGGLTIVPSRKDKETDADTVWLFTVLPRDDSGSGTYLRDAFLVAPGQQDIDCRASYKRLYDCYGFNYCDVVVIKAKDGDRFCYLRRGHRPRFIEIHKECNGGPVCTNDTVKSLFDGMFVFTEHSDDAYEGAMRASDCQNAFYAASCVYYGIDARKIGHTQPDPAGIVVM